MSHSCKHKKHHRKCEEIICVPLCPSPRHGMTGPTGAGPGVPTLYIVGNSSSVSSTPLGLTGLTGTTGTLLIVDQFGNVALVRRGQ